MSCGKSKVQGNLALDPLVEEMRQIVLENQRSSVEFLQEKLHTNISTGIDPHFIPENQKIYGQNKIPQRPITPFYKIYFGTFKDPILIILVVSAVVSIVVGASVPEQRTEGGWIDGIAIIVAVLIVSLVQSINDYSKEKQFRKLAAAKESRDIQVLRNNDIIQINIYDLVVGDICILEQGEQVPGADGFLCSNQHIKMDQSQVTGESDAITKNEANPHIISGTLVSEGSGRMIVTSVGVNSLQGVTMMALQEDNEIETPLQTKLNFLVKIVGYIGMGVAIAVFLVLIFRFLAAKKYTRKENFSEWVNYLILAITIVVVAIPEGLPLAVTISLAYSMKKMIKDQCLVRKLQSCETCGSVSVICSDKTGTLTQNQMKATNYWTLDVANTQISDYSVANQFFDQLLSLNCSLGSNCQLDGNKVVGSKTSGAFMLFARDTFQVDYKKVRVGMNFGGFPNASIAFQIDFSSKRKRANIVLDVGKTEFTDKHSLIKQTVKKPFLSFVKGASEIVLEKCKYYIDKSGQQQPLTEQHIEECKKKINEFANKSLRTLITAYCEVDSVPADDNEAELATEKDLVFQALFGVQDPLRPGVPEAIKQLAEGGIRTIMVTGDNFNTAIAISKDAGIIPAHATPQQVMQLAIQGPDLRKLDDKELDKLLETLCCVARCQPTDKFRVVQRLQKMGHVVAATGDGSNDAPQLKESDVGLAMGIAGTEIAKEASDIVILDDNFVSIVQAVRWGRSVMENIRKFVQFQITVNVVALVITFLGSAVLAESPLTSIQLLYVNLIQDSLGSLALATEGPTDEIMMAKPVARKASIITPGMLRNILVVSSYELIIMLLMMFNGIGDIVVQSPLSAYPEEASIEHWQIKYRYTSIYNFFIIVQCINLVNSRRIRNEINVFKGICRTWLFPLVFIIILGFQFVIMFTPGLKDIFKVFDCGKTAWTQCHGLNITTGKPDPTLPLVFTMSGITWQTWLIDIGCSLFVFFVHMIGRAVKTADEFGLRKDVDPVELKKRTTEQKKSEFIRVAKSFTYTNENAGDQVLMSAQIEAAAGSV